ncbi:hypothetical protein CDO73_01750 [Saccharibacillus sp. O23]|uniref:YwqG family protein n=1 Tax=Saccharibacillus sp. O23 TaxID=2009338 RepID=UPI000B4E03BD|nr:YwqG family protein [Saccharibacillus sp. O23]OWR32359.1 hypothetical protein CDO73_01750 [Saccharibacillus sp. O23]
MQKDPEVQALIERGGLDRIAESLQRLTKLSNRMTTVPTSDEEIPPGRSKIGGRPDLLAGTPWPLHNGKPLTFIAQIRLEDAPLTAENLPQSGLLSFFYDAAEQPWGYSPKHAGSWKVMYTADTEALERVSPPAESGHDGDLEPLSVEFSVQTTLPDWNTLAVRRMDLNEEEIDLYIELMEQITEHNAPGFPIHRFLGNPDQVQGEMQLKCQLVTHGIDCGSPVGYRDPRRAELEPGADGWKLLLQIDSEDDTGMTWGDFGMIYFWIHEDDLKRGDFDNVWVVLQCG